IPTAHRGVATSSQLISILLKINQSKYKQQPKYSLAQTTVSFPFKSTTRPGWGGTRPIACSLAASTQGATRQDFCCHNLCIQPKFDNKNRFFVAIQRPESYGNKYTPGGIFILCYLLEYP